MRMPPLRAIDFGHPASENVRGFPLHFRRPHLPFNRISMKRPVSLTIISRLLLISAVTSLGSTVNSFRSWQTLESFGVHAEANWTLISLGVLTNVLAIASGIGILNGQRWGHRVRLGFLVLSALVSLVSFFYIQAVGVLVTRLAAFAIIAFVLQRASVRAYFQQGDHTDATA